MPEEPQRLSRFLRRQLELHRGDPSWYGQRIGPGNWVRLAPPLRPLLVVLPSFVSLVADSGSTWDVAELAVFASAIAATDAVVVVVVVVAVGKGVVACVEGVVPVLAVLPSAVSLVVDSGSAWAVVELC